LADHFVGQNQGQGDEAHRGEAERDDQPFFEDRSPKPTPRPWWRWSVHSRRSWNWKLKIGVLNLNNITCSNFSCPNSPQKK
jgi:hypothetical protein